MQMSSINSKKKIIKKEIELKWIELMMPSSWWSPSITNDTERW